MCSTHGILHTQAYLNGKRPDDRNNIDAASNSASRSLRIVIPYSFFACDDGSLGDTAHEVDNTKLDDVTKTAVKRLSKTVHQCIINDSVRT